ncbi:hypothetical protein ANO11243_058100 [Dothideomycetidae sp. 11243]|nr:hypothetical protein ANO11243_058100 [fungal sp. No.11243]
MGDAALGSDHVNYLVLRYLQENGFEDSAKSLYREWNRHDQFRDPESLPFAHVVKQQELVHIIQDGLYHDELQAKVANGPRRFHLTNPRSRDEFPLPPPKRVRQSNASEIITNGDAMDVDDRADDEDRTSNASFTERAQSEPEPQEELPIIETKVAGTQTDKKKKLKTRTIYWTLDKSLPIAILHSLWNPKSETSSLLLAAGESICRLYNLSSTDNQRIENTDAFGMTADHVVTAAAWHPGGQHFTCAIRGPSQTGDFLPMKNHLVDIDVSGDIQSLDNWFDMITIALRYSKSGNTLFAASTDGTRTVLEARDFGAKNNHKCSVAHEYIHKNVIIDIACISDSTFAVCGKGQLSVWSLGPEPSAADSVERSLVQDYKHAVSAAAGFDKVRYDHRHQILVATASYTGDLCTIRKDGDSWIAGPEIKAPKAARPTISAAVFQPMAEDTDLSTPSRLAIAFDAAIAIYTITSTDCSQPVIVTIGPQEPPLALAWSPSSRFGARLAAASDEAIKIWDVAASPAAELLAWKAAPANWYQGDDNHLPDDEDAQTEPTLGWDVNGESLAFAVGRKHQNCVPMHSVSGLRREEVVMESIMLYGFTCHQNPLARDDDAQGIPTLRLYDFNPLHATATQPRAHALLGSRYMDTM